MDLSDLVKMFKEDRKKFDKIVKELDSVTKFVVLEPFKVVFTKFINTESLLEGFINKVKEDLRKRMLDSPKEDVDLYEKIFRQNMLNFINYYK